MFNKKSLILGAASVLLASGLAGCGGANRGDLCYWCPNQDNDIMEKIVEEFELYGKEYRLETGELAKQTTGAVLVGQGDTTVLVTAVISNEEKDYDFCYSRLVKSLEVNDVLNRARIQAGIRFR